VTPATEPAPEALGDRFSVICQTLSNYERQPVWDIELFFRWVKQTLRIKHFIGLCENAVRIQIAVALIAFLLLRLAQATQNAVTSPLEFARLVRANLMHRRPINRLLEPLQLIPTNPNQLSLRLCFP